MNLLFGEYELKDCRREVEYIEDLFKNIQVRYKKLLKFFGLKKIDRPVRIVVWDSLDGFRKNEIKQGRKIVPDWLCGVARTEQDFYSISTLTLEELAKTKAYRNPTLRDLENLIVHEIVHSLHNSFCLETGTNPNCRWLSEALATSLSDQSYRIEFDCTEIQLINDDFISYDTCRVIGDYLLNVKGESYIKRLLVDTKFLGDEIPNIYSGAKAYYENLSMNI